MNSQQLATFSNASRAGVANATREGYMPPGSLNSCGCVNQGGCVLSLPPPRVCGCSPAMFSSLNGMKYAFISNGYGTTTFCNI